MATPQIFVNKFEVRVFKVDILFKQRKRFRAMISGLSINKSFAPSQITEFNFIS